MAGELVPGPAVPDEIGPTDRTRLPAAVRARIAGVLARDRIDVIHMHGLDFGACLPPPGPAVLVTLHLPLDWYAPGALRPGRPSTWLHPVSAAQARTAPSDVKLGAPIENGVRMPQRAARRRGFALVARPGLPGEGDR